MPGREPPAVMNAQCKSSEVRQVAPASPPAAPSRWRARTPVIAAALIGLVWSGFASYFVWKWETGVARQELKSAADGHFLALQNGLNEYLNKLIALRTFFEASEDISREEFETFGTRLLQGQKAVQNFSWVPLVSRAERARHEHLARWEGIPKYEIKALTVDDKIIPSPERTEYLPIYYSTVERGTRIYGVDLLSQPIIRNRLEPARDNNQLSAVPEFYLHSRDGAVHGFLFSLPVYRRDMAIDTVEQRRAHLIGIRSRRLSNRRGDRLHPEDRHDAARPRYLSLSRRCSAGCRATSRPEFPHADDAGRAQVAAGVARRAARVRSPARRRCALGHGCRADTERSDRGPARSRLACAVCQPVQRAVLYLALVHATRASDARTEIMTPSLRGIADRLPSRSMGAGRRRPGSPRTSSRSSLRVPRPFQGRERHARPSDRDRLLKQVALAQHSRPARMSIPPMP